MGYTRIKFCGVTRPADGRIAARLGADAIGLVFHPPSGRAVDPETARSVVRALPPFVTTVGLFLDPDADRVRATLDAVPLDMLQFHGTESADFCRSFGRPYIKAVPMDGDTDPGAAAEAFPDARGLLFDSHAHGSAGGTGETFAWSRLPRSRRFHLILAGGLSPANVARAVASVQPDAVDVSSGVESAKGIKDEGRMQQFIEEVRRGDRNEG